MKMSRLLQIATSQGGGAIAAVNTVTWNPADKNASITLTNGNLTADGSGAGWQSARATHSRSDATGRYFEATKTGGNFTGICIANATAVLTNYFGIDTNGVMYLSNGEIVYGGATLTTVTIHSNGDIMGVAAKSGKVWFYVNGVLQSGGDPAAGTGGHSVPGIGATIFPGYSDTSSNAITANFGATAFTYAAPAGFVAWNVA